MGVGQGSGGGGSAPGRVVSLERTSSERRRVYVPMERRAKRFLEVLATCGNATTARLAAGLGKDRIYQHRKANAPFAAAWAAALDAFAARAEADDEALSDAALEPDGMIVRRGRSGRLQVVARRPNLWSKAKEEAFFEHFTETNNVGAASLAAGFTSKTAWERRRICPAFRDRFAAAREDAYEKLEYMLIEAGTELLSSNEAARRNPDLAMWLLRRRDQAAAGSLKRGGRFMPKQPSIEEVTAKMITQVGAIKRHRENGQLAEGWTRDEAGNMIPPGWVRAESR
ncbi:MAG: hypothetical protein E6G94_11700 [Alphaproteobacteria bacterium]|nr:MAG: hypothetical protein E6G94_11700 [Alphaproteobacteria bacterium]